MHAFPAISVRQEAVAWFGLRLLEGGACRSPGALMAVPGMHACRQAGKRTCIRMNCVAAWREGRLCFDDVARMRQLREACVLLHVRL